VYSKLEGVHELLQTESFCHDIRTLLLQCVQLPSSNGRRVVPWRSRPLPEQPQLTKDSLGQCVQIFTMQARRFEVGLDIHWRASRAGDAPLSIYSALHEGTGEDEEHPVPRTDEGYGTALLWSM